MNRQRRIGLLGGSFNPVHNGHLIMAETAMKKMNLDEIWFIPVSNHPLKSNHDLLDYNIRIELLNLVLKEMPYFRVFDFKASENSPDYTDIMMMKLYRDFPQLEFFFLIGADLLTEMPRWHNYEWLLNNVNFVIFNRPGKEIEHELLKIKNHIILEMPPQNISSSDIRNQIRQGKDISSLVPEVILVRLKSLFG